MRVEELKHCKDCLYFKNGEIMRGVRGQILQGMSFI